MISIFQLTQFYLWTYPYEIRITYPSFELYLSFELVALGLLLLHIVLNKDIIQSIKSLIELSNKEKENLKPTKKKEQTKSIEIYLAQYKDKTQNELQKIIDEGKHVTAAIKAATQLLEEKK